MTGRMTIPLGPQHPLLKEPLSIELDVAGEQIVDARVRIGYVHRGIERLCQERTFAQNVALVERICGICSHAHTTTYCQAVETLMGIQVPERAVYIRALFCELERIHSHLLWMGVLAEAIGFTTVFMYAWRDREIVLDMMEQLSGGRIAHAANILGGVRVDLSAQAGRDVMSRLNYFREQMRLFRQMVERDRSFHRRTQGVGRMTLDMVHELGVVGPLARAAGCPVDLRRDAPYGAYPSLEWRVATGVDGDVWSVAQVRMEEIEQSISLCAQVVRALPEGPLSVDVPRRAPAGEIVARSEAPRGELVYYVKSDGGDRPTRVKVRTPSLPALLALESVLPGLETADLAAVIAGADLCIACADR